MQSPETVVTAGYGSHIVVNSAVVVDGKPAVQILQVPQVPPPPYPVHLVSQQISQQDQGQKPLQVGYSCDAGQSEEDTSSVIEIDEKKAILKHPLFPLMALLFEKCEQATQTSDCPTAESINMDINSFVDHHQDKNFVGVKSTELDQLMIKAVQVLRIHLLELEKVNDLCQDFCTRYISCLKSKLQNEQLLRIDGVDFDSPVSSPSSFSSQTTAGLATSNVVSGGGTVYQMIQTAQGLVAQPVQIQAAIAPAPAVVQGPAVLSQLNSKSDQTTPQKSVSGSMERLTAVEDEGKSQRRGVLPKQATQVMKSWLFQHIVHPYPTEDEKRDLSQQTGLSILQINNWFINARRRILQPMLDSTATDFNKSKKPKPPQNRPQKFWPEHLANYLNKQSEESGDEPMGDCHQGNLNTDMQQTQLTSKGLVVHQTVLDMFQQVETNSSVQSIISNVQNAKSFFIAENGHLDDLAEMRGESREHLQQSRDVSEQLRHPIGQSDDAGENDQSSKSMMTSQQTGDVTEKCHVTETGNAKNTSDKGSPQRAYLQTAVEMR